MLSIKSTNDLERVFKFNSTMVFIFILIMEFKLMSQSFSFATITDESAMSPVKIVIVTRINL